MMYMFKDLEPISKDFWKQCFQITVKKPQADYYHLHLVLLKTAPLDKLKEKLIPYYEVAHHDARKRFNDVYGISLAPFNISNKIVSYPHSLPEETIKGFFGEVFCAIVALNFDIHLKEKWKIPAFLFREHSTAGQYLHRLGKNIKASGGELGRTGDDFLAIVLNNKFQITNCLVSESKCHEKFNITKAGEVFEKISDESISPTSLGQLKDIIREMKIDNLEEIIKGIDEIIFYDINKPPKHKRIDLFLYAFENPGVKQYPPTRISDSKAHEKYTAQRKIQAVELHFPEMMKFIKELYNELYSEKK